MNEQNISCGLEKLVSDKRIGIIYGVLKRLNIRPSHPDYDDLFQEGCLAFAEAYAHFPGNNNGNFPAFAYQRVYWRLLDILHRQYHHDGLAAFSLDDQAETAPEPPVLAKSDQEIERVFSRTYFAQLASTCSPKQRRYLHAALIWKLSDQQIATHYHVSPAAVYQWKRGIIEKARQLDYNKGEFGVKK